MNISDVVCSKNLLLKVVHNRLYYARVVLFADGRIDAKTMYVDFGSSIDWLNLGAKRYDDLTFVAGGIRSRVQKPPVIVPTRSGEWVVDELGARGSGRTSLQLKLAPKGSLFVWGGEYKYFIELPAAVAFRESNGFNPCWCDREYLSDARTCFQSGSKKYTRIILDHALTDGSQAPLTDAELDGYQYLKSMESDDDHAA